MSHLPPPIVAVVKGLVDSDIRNRALISQTDFGVFLGYKALGEMEEALS